MISDVVTSKLIPLRRWEQAAKWMIARKGDGPMELQDFEAFAHYMGVNVALVDYYRHAGLKWMDTHQVQDLAFQKRRWVGRIGSNTSFAA